MLPLMLLGMNKLWKLMWPKNSRGFHVQSSNSYVRVMGGFYVEVWWFDLQKIILATVHCRSFKTTLPWRSSKRKMEEITFKTFLPIWDYLVSVLDFFKLILSNYFLNSETWFTGLWYGLNWVRLKGHHNSV